MAEAEAQKLGVPPDRLAAFAEVYAALGRRGAQSWQSLLDKVRSSAEVEAAIAARSDELFADAPDERARAKWFERLVFCGRYSAKVGTPLDAALNAGAAQLRAAVASRATLGEVKMAIAPATFGDEHLQCRTNAYPYRPSCSASHGDSVVEARATHPAEVAGRLLGYVAMQGSYVDDIAVEPEVQGQKVASALLAGAATAVGGGSVSLDVRAANAPAIRLYESLGFQFGDLEHPGFLDWDGGYSGGGSAREIVGHAPPNADLSAMSGGGRRCSR